MNLHFISNKYRHDMQYSSYITSTERKDTYTIKVLYMFTLHTPARLLQWCHCNTNGSICKV